LVPKSLSAQESIQLLNQNNVKKEVPIPGQISGQSQFTGSIEEYVKFNQPPPGEKIYLHLDRPSYLQGDTIWFKAYLWFGYDQLPDTISGVLYVDLLNPEGRIKLKRKLLIQNGTSQGDFCLDTTISPGSYTLRAYTRWMQNTNIGEPFYQKIIINPVNQNFQVDFSPSIIRQAGNDSLQISFRFFEIYQTGGLKNSYNHNVNYSLRIGDQILHSGEVQAVNTKEQVFRYNLPSRSETDSIAIFGVSIQDEGLTFEKEFRIPLYEGIDLQFFPEGGRLVTGLESRVAFKTIGTDGLSREVNGEIETGEGEIITAFGSSHKGMGTFLLKPEAKKNYFAHLWYNNRKYIIPLPSASEEGCVISVSFVGNGSTPYLTLKQNHFQADSQKYVIGSAYDKIWFSAIVKNTKDSCRFRIPFEILPEGVSRLTLLNENFVPECERLIFIDKKERFKIGVEADSSHYGTRSKVTLLIKTTGLDGKPAQTDLSLAVVDKEQITKGEELHGICAYKLLESELKGYIEDVGFYFKDDSCINYRALDLLLLTQGYRNFLTGNRKADELKYQPEKTFDISGKIKLIGSKSREKKFNYQDINLTLLCRSLNVYLDQSHPDSLGQFRFQIPLLYGKISSLLQATTSKRKPFYGEIVLDETLTTLRFKSQPIAPDKLAQPEVEYFNQLQAVKKTEISKNPAYGIKTINLPEVTVKAKSKNWYRDFDRNAEKIANLDSLDPTGNKYRSLNDILVKEFGARYHETDDRTKTIFLPVVSMKMDYWYPVYVINDETFLDEAEPMVEFYSKLYQLSTFPVNEIKKLVVLSPGNIPAHYASTDISPYVRQSLVVIETYSNNTLRGDPPGIKTFILDGLDAPRIFYSPRYEGIFRNSPIYDGRATLHWEPSIRTDANGQAKVEFFTSDNPTTLEIIVNGIEPKSGNSGQMITHIVSGILKSY